MIMVPALQPCATRVALLSPQSNTQIPGRMVNYVEDRSYQTQSGYRKIEGTIHRPRDPPQAREALSQDSAAVRQEQMMPLVSNEHDDPLNRYVH